MIYSRVIIFVPISFELRVRPRVLCVYTSRVAGAVFQHNAERQVDDATSKSQRGRRVKQSRPTRSASPDDVNFRGVICRFVMTFDGRQTHLNISTEFRQVLHGTGVNSENVQLGG